MNQQDETNKQTSSEIKDFDEILTHIGGWGRFQYMLTLIYFPFNIFLGYILLSPILTLYTPDHWCLIPELSNFTLEERKSLAIPPDPEAADGYSSCKQYLVNWTQVK